MVPKIFSHPRIWRHVFKSTTTRSMSGERRGGRVPGSEGYSESDVRALLTCVGHVLPGGRRDWARVLKKYRRSYAEPHMRSQRDVNSIKSKFRQILNLKPKASGKPHSSTVEAQRIQSAIKDRLRAVAEGTAAPAPSDDSGVEDMDEDGDEAVHQSADTVNAASDVAAPSVSVESAAAITLAHKVAASTTSLVLTPDRRENAPSVRTTSLVSLPSSSPTAVVAASAVGHPQPPAVAASPLRRSTAAVAAASRPARDGHRDELLDDDVPLSAHQLLAARVTMLEQQNFTLSTRMQSVNDAAHQVLTARVAALEQQNTALTARLAVVGDAADEFKNKNFDLREEIIQLKSEFARVEAENRVLASRVDN